MNSSDSNEELQKKISQLESRLAEVSEKLQTSGIELEANEALLKLAMEDMRRIYEDLMRSQTQLAQSDKLATIGLLTAGIVHEINNPLSAVKLVFSLLQTQLQKIDSGDSSEATLKDFHDYVEQGKKCAETMTKIVNDIRMFSRSDKGIMNDENINAIIDSVIGIVWNSVKNKVVIKKQYSVLPQIKCNAQQMSQVFLNLIVNASQAIGEEHGDILISTESDYHCVNVKISDTGCGMSKDVMEKIFEPFFTTKGAEQGTGLGLSITHDIVKKHRGAISVRSEIGKGTTFTVSLPRHEA